MNKVLATRQVLNRIENKTHLGQIELLDKESLIELVDLQECIFTHLKCTDLFVKLSEKEFEEILGEKGVVVGFKVDGRLCGFSGILFPGQRDDNLGRDIGLTTKELLRVAHLETSGVHPAYRGNDLQRIITSFLIKEAKAREGWEYLMNTVSPFNYPSLLTTVSMKMQIIKLLEKYGGKIRYIFYRNVRKKEKISPESMLWVSTEDIAYQKELLDKGYRGYDVRKSNGKPQMAFGLLTNREEVESCE